jgi:hypothetical protein
MWAELGKPYVVLGNDRRMAANYTEEPCRVLAVSVLGQHFKNFKTILKKNAILGIRFGFLCQTS